MIQIITGLTGEGKTKQLIHLANEKSRQIKGHVVYIDSATTHRFDLSHHVRLIETPSIPLQSSHDFFGFLCGILSSNHDIEVILIDELIKITHLGIDELVYFFEKLKTLSTSYHVDLIVGTSCAHQDIPMPLKPYLVA